MNASRLLLAPILFGTLALATVAPAHGQDAQTTATDTAVVVDDDRDDGFDWGLLGLLGLLGLMPRKRADVVVHRDDATRTGTNPDGTNRL